jgi:hypothetical protein
MPRAALRSGHAERQQQQRHDVVQITPSHRGHGPRRRRRSGNQQRTLRPGPQGESWRQQRQPGRECRRLQYLALHPARARQHGEGSGHDQASGPICGSGCDAYRCNPLCGEDRPHRSCGVRGDDHKAARPGAVGDRGSRPTPCDISSGVSCISWQPDVSYHMRNSSRRREFHGSAHIARHHR